MNKNKSTTEQKVENSLQTEIEQLLSSKNEDVGIHNMHSKSTESTTVNASDPYAMLSTFKFPIALAVLDKVEQGEHHMQQIIVITKEDLLENTWSPFREKYPDANVSITLEEALNWMLQESDNNITDVLLRLVGGTETVENFLNNNQIVIKNNEAAMHIDWDSQFVNTATPLAYTNLLKEFDEGKILNKEHTLWLYNAMAASKTGTARLKGKLPNVVIAQRSGSSFTNDAGVTGATNNVGIIELPNGEKIYISVFLRNTTSNSQTSDAIIANIAKIAYDHYAMQQ
ncbi:MAG: class A beta-lactamase [Nonlabens sp.]|nr:class A beta-lactamase [Nonlabens sp.]